MLIMEQYLQQQFATVCRNQMFLKGVVFLIFILNASMNLVIIASPGYNS